MAKITRKNQKIFADSAAASQITVFGSIKENSPNPPDYSKDPDLIQSNEYMQGWTGATQDDYAPYRQDMNAIQYLITRQLAYLFQAGIPEYDSATQYYANSSFCQINGVVYLCIQDALNKLPSTEPTYWKEIDFSKLAPKDSPALTGNPTAPTQLNTDNSTKIATTAFVKNVLGGYAPVDSPTLTGTPKAPTPAVGDNSTKIATTQFVFNAMSGASINMPLFHYFWSDYEVNDVNFLRADTFSWQDGTAYSGPYQHLVDDIDGKTIQTETVEGITIQYYEADDGHKICPASEEANVLALYTMSGAAWYYILDTVNQRFKLPRINPNKEILGLSAPSTVSADGLMKYKPSASSSNIYTPFFNAGNNEYVRIQSGSVVAGNLYYYSGLKATTDLSSKTGIFSGKKYLYFYVGNFTQTAIENTAGLNASLFNGKADVDLNNTPLATADYVVEKQDPTADNNYTWYRKYKSGWVEQGGISRSLGFRDSTTITLPVAFADTHYFLTSSADSRQTYGNRCNSYSLDTKTTTTFQIYGCFEDPGSGVVTWEAKGFAAS